MKNSRHQPTYNSWSAMIQRCTNERHTCFARYGGRGITVCARWRDSYAAFLEDMGQRPEETTLDRRDNDGNYEPSNCRWATHEVQSRNAGGAREGAGRPPLIAGKRSVYRPLKLTEEEAAAHDAARGEMPWPDWIRAAAEAYMQQPTAVVSGSDLGIDLPR